MRVDRFDEWKYYKVGLGNYLAGGNLMSEYSNDTVNDHALGEGSQWTEWIGHLIAALFLELAVILCTLLVLAVLIKIVQAHMSQTQKTWQDITLKQDQYKQQLSYNSISSAINQLKTSHQTLVIYYSLYKQLLYLISGAYHATNLTSIFATLNKLSTQHQSKHFQSIFQSSSINRFQNIIIITVSDLISSFQGIIVSLQISDIKIKDSVTQSQKYPIEQQKKPDFKLSDLFQYNLPMKASLLKLKEKVSELNEALSRLQQHRNHQQFLELIKNSVFLISSFSSIHTHLTNDIIHLPQCDLNKRNIVNQPVEQQINSILSQICNQPIKYQYQADKKQSKSSLLLSLQNNLSDAINQYNLNSHSSFTTNPTLIHFLDHSVSNLNKLLHQIQINNSQITNLKLPNPKPNNQIKVYSANKTLSDQKQPQLSTDSPQKNKNITQTTQKDCDDALTVHEVQASFSAQNKLSFIKQLDKLMVRNRIRRQMEETQQRMKQEQQIEQLQNCQLQPHIILQKI